MLFNSYVFVFAFFPVTLTVYYIMGHFALHTAQKIWLIAASLFFYGYFNQSYLLIIGASILINFALSRLIIKNLHGSGKCAKLLLIVGVVANLGLLFYFKYYDFFIENVNVVFKTDFALRHIVLPLGISFFTFQQLSYVIDSYHGEVDNYDFWDYALFVSFFPQLVAGPIVLHNEILPQFQKKENLHFHVENFSHGIYMFAIGLFKKVLIADTLGAAVTWGFSTYDTLSSLETILVVLSYTFQIYFDFSGYCDMAGGIAKMFNITLPLNFNSPYKSLNIVEFWERWHMTLTRFLRQYVYFPLGGSRKGALRTYVNIMVVFLLSGLWHGANWTFILWGALHGIFNVVTRAFRSTWDKMHTAFQWLITFAFVNVGWLLFRADSIGQAWQMLKKAVSLSSFTLRTELLSQFRLVEYNVVFSKIPPISYFEGRIAGFAMWCLLALCLFVTLNCKNCYEMPFKPTVKSSVFTAALLIWSIVSLGGVSVFLYFNF